MAEPDRDLRLRTLLDRASDRIGGRFAGQPLAEAAIRYTLGRAYLNLGDHQLAETHALRAVEIQKEVLEATDPVLVRSQVLLMATRVSQGRYREVLDDLESLLRFAETHFTMENELSVEAAYWLSRTYAQLSRTGEGERLMTRYLPISQSALPPDHWLRPTIVNERGYYHVAYRRMAEAERYSRKWLSEYRANFGREHPYSIMLMHNLATSLIYQGKYDEAREVYRETLDLQSKVLGPEHPSRIKTLAESAWYYRFTDQMAAAQTVLEDAFEQARRVLGHAHPETRRISSWLSGLYLRTGGTNQQRQFLVSVLRDDPENQYALEHLAGFVAGEALSPIMSDGEEEPVRWKYTMRKPAPGWERPDFDDSEWLTGAAPFGNSTPPGYRTLWDTPTIWLRREFEVPEVPDGRVLLRVLQDDHSLVFLNGVAMLERQSWTGRRRILMYPQHAADLPLNQGRNVVAIRADNVDLEGVIDIGIYAEPVSDDDDNPVPPLRP